ncbi:hypothetical protein Ddye_019893 [Dipteronia dyeriana]|uniref:Uncharacterized protein n=1 Tax=Dipteronia dyeriana TaxID=168575 RepID=A0AAD9TZ80_9ROSI|nr:hypothetical protein Ddye_019893 [Dipteronia dyeriana]
MAKTLSKSKSNPPSSSGIVRSQSPSGNDVFVVTVVHELRWTVWSSLKASEKLWVEWRRTVLATAAREILGVTWKKAVKSMGMWDSVREFARMYDGGMMMIIFSPLGIGILIMVSIYFEFRPSSLVSSLIKHLAVDRKSPSSLLETKPMLSHYCLCSRIHGAAPALTLVEIVDLS